jgi:hypothetical protein
MLARILLIALSVTLVVVVYAMRVNTTQISVGHDTFTAYHGTWLHEVREVTLYGVLIWCFIFARREPTFVRVGLAALFLAFLMTALSPATVKHAASAPLSWH